MSSGASAGVPSEARRSAWWWSLLFGLIKEIPWHILDRADTRGYSRLARLDAVLSSRP